MKKLGILLLAVLLSLTACSTPAPSAPSQAPEQLSDSYYPVAVDYFNEVCEQSFFTYPAKPQRIVSISQANTELMLYLGVDESTILGTASIQSEPDPQLAGKFNKIEQLAEGYPAKEVVVALNPDLIVGWGSLFADSAMGPSKEWNDKGVGTYLMVNSIVGFGDRTVERLYGDIIQLGRVFDLQEEAAAMIQDMKTSLANIEEKVSTIPEDQRIRVSTIQSINGNELSMRGDTDFNADLVKKAGGVHLNGYGKYSTEVLIEQNPDVIVIIEHRGDGAGKIEELKNNPSLQQVKAIQNDNFYILPHAAFYCGSQRTVPTIEDMAAHFYPELFEAA